MPILIPGVTVIEVTITYDTPLPGVENLNTTFQRCTPVHQSNSSWNDIQGESVRVPLREIAP